MEATGTLFQLLNINKLTQQVISFVTGINEITRKKSISKIKDIMFSILRDINGGGIGHDRLHYALFDLTQFLLLPKVIPSSENIEILEKNKLHKRFRAS